MVDDFVGVADEAGQVSVLALSSRFDGQSR